MGGSSSTTSAPSPLIEESRESNTIGNYLNNLLQFLQPIPDETRVAQNPVRDRSYYGSSFTSSAVLDIRGNMGGSYSTTSAPSPLIEESRGSNTIANYLNNLLQFLQPIPAETRVPQNPERDRSYYGSSFTSSAVPDIRGTSTTYTHDYGSSSTSSAVPNICGTSTTYTHDYGSSFTSSAVPDIRGTSTTYTHDYGSSFTSSAVPNIRGTSTTYTHDYGSSFTSSAVPNIRGTSTTNTHDCGEHIIRSLNDARPTVKRYNSNLNKILQSNNYDGYDDSYFPAASKIQIIRFNLPRYIPNGELYQCFSVPNYSSEYNEIRRMITNRYFQIVSIERIENPLLRKSYDLRKEQKGGDFSVLGTQEMRLFHGTKKRNVDKICKSNFNWRLCGSGTGHRFGLGVSFSCNAMYAAHYSSDSGLKVMFLVDVLVGRTCQGHGTMVLPPEGCDTSLKNSTSHIVVVKYEDNEFYPAYKIMFHIAPGYVPKNAQNKRGGNQQRRQRVRQYSSDYDDDLDYIFYD